MNNLKCISSKGGRKLILCHIWPRRGVNNNEKSRTLFQKIPKHPKKSRINPGKFQKIPNPVRPPKSNWPLGPRQGGGGSVKNRDLWTATYFFNDSLNLYRNSVVVDVGFESTNIVPLHKGKVITEGVQRIPIGGQDVTDHLVDILNNSGYSYQTCWEKVIKILSFKGDCNLI